MAIRIDTALRAADLLPAIERLWTLSDGKIRSLDQSWDRTRGTPVYTVAGRYTSRGWTEWTQGFEFGSMLLQFEATKKSWFLDRARWGIREYMATHVSHVGVHDHGFNNVSTYGQLWRQMREGFMAEDPRERECCELALKASGAVQASRWTPTEEGAGFIYSFNGPHSLFIDTIRSLRALALAHGLGHVLMGEGDRRISLLERIEQHIRTTVKFAVYFGEGRDVYDVRGRVAHESLFNTKDGRYRCPSTQQGYSPFTTWTRGLAWAILGFAEQLEFFRDVLGRLARSTQDGGKRASAKPERRGDTVIVDTMLRAAEATADYYLEIACADGVPYWDTGAPNLHRIRDGSSRRSDPFNAWEPVDSSAAAIAAQGLLRLGDYLHGLGRRGHSRRYRQAGLTIARTLLAEPYLSVGGRHQGLLLHSVYHRPNGWDHVARGQKAPNGESSMWGDYHLRELALMIWREGKDEPRLTFYGPMEVAR